MSDIRIATAEDQILLDKEAKYCSYGDTVHYIEPPRIFRGVLMVGNLAGRNVP